MKGSTISFKELLQLTGLPVLVASLCCLAPVIFVLLGLSTVSFAASLADTLYGDFKWLFRGVGLAALALSVYWYLRTKRGICTLDQAKQRRNEIINVILLSLSVGVIGYIVWLYVVVELLGLALGIWN